MPLPEPRVLRRLQALGLSQTALASHLGVTQAAVSMWLAGKRPFIEPWRSDADALLAVVSEHLAQGKPLATVAFLPTHFMNRGGTTRTGTQAPITEEDHDALIKLQQELIQQSPDRFMAATSAWHARHTATHIAEQLPIDPQADLSAKQLDALRRMAQALVLNFDTLLHLKARTALEESNDADQTP